MPSDLIRGGHRFSDKDMRDSKARERATAPLSGRRPPSTVAARISFGTVA